MAEYAYVRVSSIDQNEARQMIAMKEQGIPEKNIFLDKQSGKDFERPGFQRMVRKLKPGDVLFIKSIDRLGRNYDEILWQWRFLVEKKECAIVVLDMPLLDTRSGKDLMGKVISDIVLQLLSYVAQTEREFNKQRQAEGIAAAKARGVLFGRKPIPIPPQFEQAYADWKAGYIGSRVAAHEYCGVSHRTFLKWVKEKEASIANTQEAESTDGSQGGT